MPAWPRRYGNGGAVLRWLRPMDAAIMCPPLLGMRCPMGLVLADGWLPFLCRPAGWSGVRCLQAGAWGPSFGLLPRTVFCGPRRRVRMFVWRRQRWCARCMAMCGGGESCCGAGLRRVCWRGCFCQAAGN